jgi:ABA responsive element binding factor
MNFKNFNDATVEEAGMKPLENIPLCRQTSIYSLTFDEFQNTLGGYAGKEFGSMNMDELMKNIWSVEENQNQAPATDGVDRSVPWNNLQRQGSLILPRTISTKTVDEVFKDLIKDSGVAKDNNSTSGGGGGSGSNMPQRQPTLGEITLEEFLVRAGVVREDTQPVVRSDNGGFYGDIMRQNNNNNGLAIEFQQQSRNTGLLSNGAAVPCQVPGLSLNVRGVGSQQQAQYQQPPLFPKQTNLALASPGQLMNHAEPANAGVHMKKLVQASGLPSNGNGMVGVRAGGATGSPASKVSPELPSLSPVPYAFGRGRKPSAAVEKVVERRQRRMIKNRESASRSRARKQAYTLELEAEVAKLKELNQELQRKQAEIMEMENDQLLEKMNHPWGNKRQCLRRTLTGPW